MRCEDYPCCGHTPGDPCPDRDADGRIVPRCVTCDRKLARGARSSICGPCQRRARQRDDDYGDHDYSMNF
jgi:hypothetical protein